MQNENYRMLENIYEKLLWKNRLHVGDYSLRDLLHDVIIRWTKNNLNRKYESEEHLYNHLRKMMFNQRASRYNEKTRDGKKFRHEVSCESYEHINHPSYVIDEELTLNVLDNFPAIKMSYEGYSTYDIGERLNVSQKTAQTQLTAERNTITNKKSVIPKCSINKNKLGYDIYQMHVEGFSKDEIALKFGIKVKAVENSIYNRKKEHVNI
jgi:DNA-directed RNA polymerase specialized sigma24 family protein